MAANPESVAFVWAVKNRKSHEVQRLLAQDTTNACIQPITVLRVTALQIAAWQGDINLLNQLIDRGADVKSVDSLGRSALYYAADRGHAEITRRLLDCEHPTSTPKLNDIQVRLPSNNHDVNHWKNIAIGKKLSFPVCWGRIPLHQAVQNNHDEVVRILVTRGAHVDVPDERSTTPLLLAGITSRDWNAKEIRKFSEIVTILVSARANINNINKKTGTTVLHHATMLGSVETIKLLMTEGAQISKCTLFGSTPLHIAARAGNNKALMALVNTTQSIDFINMRDHMGRTALHRAAFHGHRKCVKILITHGADLTAAMKTSITTINDIFTHIVQPVELLTDILDSYVHMTDNSLIEVDFEILTPVHQKHQMAVLMLMINAASDTSHLTILQHPLIETFLKLKLANLRIFFFFLIFVHLSFAVCLSIFAVKFIENNTSDILWISRILNVCSFFLLIHNLIQLLLEPKHYLKQVETWLSILCAIVSLAPAIGSEFANCDKKETEKRQCAQWILHFLCFAILLSWMQSILLIGRFSVWGYYALMFFKVLKNILKVILIFGFLIVGFALSFMIVFYGKDQFGTFWEAIVSTMVLMIGEYEYTDLFDTSSSTDDKTSDDFLPIIARIIFFSFIILITIILLNLMIGVAVIDIQALEKEGRICRLVKQAEFIAYLDRLKSHKIFHNKWIHLCLDIIMYLVNDGDISENKKENMGTKITLSPRANYFQSQYSAIPTHLMEALYLLAIETSRKSQEESVLKSDDRKFVSMIIEMITNLEDQVREMKALCYPKLSEDEFKIS